MVIDNDIFLGPYLNLALNPSHPHKIIIMIMILSLNNIVIVVIYFLFFKNSFNL